MLLPVTNPTAEFDCERRGYRLPTMPHIGSGAERLYDLESRRDKIIEACAVETGKVMGLNPKRLFQELIPEALAALLEHYDSGSSDAAAIAYLRRRGYTVLDRKE